MTETLFNDAATAFRPGKAVRREDKLERLDHMLAKLRSIPRLEDQIEELKGEVEEANAAASDDQEAREAAERELDELEDTVELLDGHLHDLAACLRDLKAGRINAARDGLERVLLAVDVKRAHI